MPIFRSFRLSICLIICFSVLGFVGILFSLRYSDIDESHPPLGRTNFGLKNGPYSINSIAVGISQNKTILSRNDTVVGGSNDGTPVVIVSKNESENISIKNETPVDIAVVAVPSEVNVSAVLEPRKEPDTVVIDSYISRYKQKTSYFGNIEDNAKQSKLSSVLFDAKNDSNNLEESVKAEFTRKRELWASFRESRNIFNSTTKILSPSQLRIVDSLSKKYVDDLLSEERSGINRLISDTSSSSRKASWTRISYSIARLGVPHTNYPKSKPSERDMTESTGWFDAVTQHIAKDASCWSLIEYSSVSAQRSISTDIALQYPFSIVLHVEILDASSSSLGKTDVKSWSQAGNGKHARSVAWSEDDWSLQNLVRFRYNPGRWAYMESNDRGLNDDAVKIDSLHDEISHGRSNPLFLVNSMNKCDLIVISDLSVLTFNILPTEFEYFLGRLILQSNKLILPSTLPYNDFFSLWPSAESLIKSSVSLFSRDSMQVAFASLSDGLVSCAFSEKKAEVESAVSSISGSSYSTHSKYSSYSKSSIYGSIDPVNDSGNATSASSKNQDGSTKIACMVVPTLSLMKNVILYSHSQLVIHPFDKSWLLAQIAQFALTPDIFSLTSGGLKRLEGIPEFNMKPGHVNKDVVADGKYFDWYNSKLIIDDIIKASTPQSPNRFSDSHSWNDVERISRTWNMLRPKLDDSPVRPDDDVLTANNDSQYWLTYDDFNDGSSLGGFSVGTYSGAAAQPARFSSTSSNYKPWSYSSTKFENIGGLYKFRFRSLAMRDQSYSSVWWPHLETGVLDNGDVNSVLLLGSRVSLLSVKLAESLQYSDPQPERQVGIVVSHLLHELDVTQHLHILRLKRLKNNIVCASRLSLTRLLSLSLPYRHQYSFVVMDDSVFWEAVRISSFIDPDRGLNDCSTVQLEIAYGLMISWGKTSFIHLPKLDVAGRVMNESHSICGSRILKKYANVSFNDSLAEENFIQRSIASAARFLSLVDAKLFNIDNLDVSVNLLSDNDFLESETSMMFKISHKTRSTVDGPGVSLHQLLHRGATASVRKQLYSLLLQLPLWSFNKNSGSMNPWEIMYSVKSLPWSKKDSPPLRAYLAFKNSMTGFASSYSYFMASFLPHLVGEEINSLMMFSVIQDALTSRLAEQDEGLFSFLELGSNTGAFSMLLANDFPNSTVLSVTEDQKLVHAHVSSVISSELFNNVVCHSQIDSEMITSIYESPELFRFQLHRQSVFGLLAAEEAKQGTMNQIVTDSTGSYQLPLLFPEEKIQSPSSRYFVHPISSTLSESFGQSLAKIISNAFTSFLIVPTPQQISFAFSMIFPNGLPRPSSLLGGSIGLHLLPSNEADNEIKSIYFASSHPRESIVIDDGGFLSEFGKNVAGGKVKLSFSRTSFPPTGIDFPILRVDVMNLTRAVHHHYGYSKDGHTRTYTMKIEVNETGTSSAARMFGSDLSSKQWKLIGAQKSMTNNPQTFSVQSRSISHFREDSHVNNNQVAHIYLTRDKDGSKIPYIHLHGFTMIAALRMGLEERLASRSFVNFLKLPMHEDMAPWNIVFAGNMLQYIDYDTRDMTFEDIIPKAFQVMEVLMNYKRTVSDLSNCGGKANVEYGVPYVGDCVGSLAFKGPCKDKEYPVPCGDHKCHSDFVSCLRSVFGVESFIAVHSIDGEYFEEASTQEKKLVPHMLNGPKAIVEFE